MRVCFNLFILVFLSLNAVAQVNYVKNPSFEEHTQCPDAVNQISKATYWSCIDTATLDPQPFYAAEYLSACAISPVVRVPGYWYMANHYARTGDAMMDAIVYCDESHPTPYQRDNTQGHLKAALTAGTSYCVTFYVCLARYAYACNNIGAYLDDGTIDTLTQGYGLVQSQYTPQVHAINIINDSINWTKVEGTFIANGTEKFITIANFYDKAHTNSELAMDPLDTAGFSLSEQGAIYLIDDVSVIESDLPAYAGNDTTINQGDSVFIGRDEIIPDIKWMANNNIIDTVHAGMWVKPTQTTTYFLEQALCGAVKYDTVTITVIPDTTIVDTTGTGVDTTDTTTNPEIVPYTSYNKGFSIYPNPSNGNFTIHSAMLKNEQVEMTVFDISGRKIREEELRFNEESTSIHLDIVAGLYLIELKNSAGGKYLQRLIIK